MKSKLILAIVVLMLAKGVLYAATPIITSFSPSSGPVGTVVTINGSNLNNSISLNIGGVKAIVISNTSTKIVAMVMPGATSGAISLLTASGNANAGIFLLTTSVFSGLQQGGKIVAIKSAEDYGYDVAISGDGNTAVVGGPGDNDNQGAAWIYIRKGNEWLQQGPKLVGTQSGSGIRGSRQGLVVAINADGNTVIVAGDWKVWIFTRNNNVWTQQGSPIDIRAYSVSISADGNTAAMGNNYNDGTGNTWIYTRNGNIWTTQGEVLITGKPLQPNYSSAISADGNTVVVWSGVYGYGASTVFSRANNIWAQQGPELYESDRKGLSGIAGTGSKSVAISADGNTFIVGGPDDNDGAGASWVFIRNNGAWQQQGPKLVGTSYRSFGYQGYSVAISADGNTAIVGGVLTDNYAGATWVFTRTNGHWVQMGDKLVGSGSIANGYTGNSVSLCANGSTAIIGGHGDNGQGAVWMFDILSSSIGNLTQMSPPNNNAIKHDNNQLMIAEPIQLGTGTYEYTHTDFRLPTVNDSLNFTRFYNSLNNSVNGPVGFGWSHTYNYQLTIQKDSASHKDVLWNLKYPDGHLSAFIPLNDSAGYSVPLFVGTQETLRKDSTGALTMHTKSNHSYHFNSTGMPDHISDLSGNITNLTYTGGKLTSVVGQGGRALKFIYTGNKIASITDPLNRSCTFTYDGVGNLKTAKDANGNATSFTYDTVHRMISAVNPLGNVIVNNTYDTTGKVVYQTDAYKLPTKISYNTPSTGDATVTNPDSSHFTVHHDSSFRQTYIKDEMGFTKNYTYDAYSNENSFMDENGQTELRTFDPIGNLLTKTKPGSRLITASYNGFNSPLKVTDPKGNITTFVYDASDNLISEILPDITTKSFTYYPNGLRKAFQDGRGQTTTYSYSTNGDLLSVTSPAGTKSYTYDAAGRRLTTTDENGNVSKISYDKNDNILILTDPLKQLTSFLYDINNQLISVTDKKGNKTSFAYDKKGRMITKTNANGGITKNTYDVMDRLVKVSDPSGHNIVYSYDQKGRKTGITNSLGTTKYKYDGAGNVAEIIDGTTKTTRYTYTPAYKAKTISDGLNNITTYSYDKNNNLLTVTDAMNKTTSYGYDAMDRLSTVIDANSKTTKITYDQNGNRKTVTDANAHTQTFTYDAASRLISFADAAGNTFGYTYDPDGNNIILSKPTGTITKSYDALNRLVAVKNSSGNNYGFTYDKNDNITNTSVAVGKTFFTYDKLNQLTQYADPFNKIVVFNYNASGNKQSVIYPGNKMVNYAYDNAGDLLKVTDWLSHVFSYSYDAAGRMTQLLYPNGIHCDYSYDAAGRLTSLKHSKQNSILAGSVFTLDPVGNRVTEQNLGPIASNLTPAAGKYVYDKDDRLLSDSIWSYKNDNAGNRISQTKGIKKTGYTFSVDNLLNEIADSTGSITAILYDAQGHRLSRSSATNSDRYVIDISGNMSQVLQIANANGITKSHYVYGAGLLERIDSLGKPLYYQFDGQHNTILLTDDNAAITDTYTYDPFGTMLVHNGNTSQPFACLGEFGVEQESTSIYYVRARYYDAANGRFLSKDAYPYSLLNPQMINRYVYSTNNPINRYDNSGLYQNQDNSGVNLNTSFSNDYQSQAGESGLTFNKIEKGFEVFGSTLDVVSNFATKLERSNNLFSAFSVVEGTGGNIYKYAHGTLTKADNINLGISSVGLLTAATTLALGAGTITLGAVTIAASPAILLGLGIAGAGFTIYGAAHAVWGQQIDDFWNTY